MPWTAISKINSLTWSGSGRLAELHPVTNYGMTYDEAKGVVAQEVGHFAKDTTEAYLR